MVKTRILAIAVAVMLALAAVGGVAGPVAGQESTDCSFPLEVTDATGETVEIDEEPERVVSLGPSAAQTVYEIGAQEKLVGISKYATYLDFDEEKTVISGDETFVDKELVVAQEPDIVLAPNIIPEETVTNLREEQGLTVVYFEESKSLDDVVEKTRLIGELVGECEGANDRAGEMEDTLDLVRTAVEGQERPTALYLLGGESAAGDETFINEVIETAGGSNIAAEHFSGYSTISRETVANESPEYIVVSSEAPEVIPRTDAYNATTAVENDQIITVNANYLNQPAPRTVEVVEDLASTWHPDAYESAQESKAEEEATTTATESPGMGGLMALLALLAVVIRTRR